MVLFLGPGKVRCEPFLYKNTVFPLHNRYMINPLTRPAIFGNLSSLSLSLALSTFRPSIGAIAHILMDVAAKRINICATPFPLVPK